MFHVAPLMPNTEDSQQIVKKRHVGNDHVHIIWCEADRDYRTYLIRSQFGLVNIIIYPQSKDVPHQGAFLIRIRTKPNIDVCVVTLSFRLSCKSISDIYIYNVDFPK